MALETIAGRRRFLCTVVSLVPFEIREPKPGLQPHEFLIPACENPNEPVCVGIAEGSYGVYLDGDRGTLRVRTPSVEIARSLVEDFQSAQLATDVDAKPGMFVVEGSLSSEEVVKEYGEELKEAIQSQNKWFVRLVKMADDSWNKYHQHGAVTDLQRFAAKSLGLDKEWLIVVRERPTLIVELKCPACFAIVQIGQAICGACSCILNEEAYEKLNFAGGKKMTSLNLKPKQEQPVGA